MLKWMCVALVAGWPAMAAEAISVQELDASLRDGVYHVSLAARVDAPIEDVAAVLTDYAAYHNLDPRIRSSVVLPPTSQGTLLVRTVVYACAGLFCRNVQRVESVERLDGELIATVIPDEGDLKSGVTHTTWRAADTATQVTYQAEFVPKFWVPTIIGRRYVVKVLKASTLELFNNVEKRARER